MPQLISNDSDLRPLIVSVINQLVAAVEQSTVKRIRQAVLRSAGVEVRRGPGRPPKNPFAVTATAKIKVRKKPPRQFCPVPNCKNPAAPVFGMVCAKHKGVSKAKIEKYREARRRAKAKA